jgi:hypothetical protein
MLLATVRGVEVPALLPKVTVLARDGRLRQAHRLRLLATRITLTVAAVG